MAFDWKKLKKKTLLLLKKPRSRLILGLGAGGLALLLLLALLTGGDEKPTNIKDGRTTEIQLVFGGDLTVTDQTVAAGGSSEDFRSFFLEVAEVFAKADGACLNFEGNFCGSPYGTQHRSAPLALAEALDAMGVDFLQMANSYSVKNGMTGLSDTLDAITLSGMTPLGAYSSNAAFAESQGYTLCTIGGIRVAFVAFTKGMDGMALPTGSEKCVNLLYTDYSTTYKTVNTAGITSVLQSVQKAKPDIVIALVHWGSEENTSVSPTQEKIAKLMMQNGVSAIIGTHSHQLQTISYDSSAGTLIAYSLGDFFGDGTNAGNQYSVLLQLEITKNRDTGACQVTGWDYVPIYTITEGREGDATRLVQIRTAMEAYENGHINKVSDKAYENMKAALAKIDALLDTEPEEEE